MIDEVHEAAEPRSYVTALSVICWSPRHDLRHEIVGISRPARIGHARFYEELIALGWQHIGHRWRCPACVGEGATAEGGRDDREHRS